ncbi:Solute carrier family 22 member 6-A [Nymphon striatum]|nr:Solute carrier family 22 member 6-A [Nymphon striatum]
MTILENHNNKLGPLLPYSKIIETSITGTIGGGKLSRQEEIHATWTFSTMVFPSFGIWQAYIFLVCSLVDLPGSMYGYVLSFYAPKLEFWCAMPEELQGTVSYEEWRNCSSPLTPELTRDPCKVFYWKSQAVNRTNICNVTYTKILECKKWDYNLGNHQRTMTSEFDLVCSKHILVSLSNSMFMIGFLVGVLLNGHLSDRYGRKKVMLANLLLMVSVSTAMVFSKNFLFFTILRIFQCFGLIGTITTSYALVVEVCPSKHVTKAGVLFSWSYSVGLMILSTLAYYVRDWFRLQIYLSVLPYLLLVMAWYVPESPRWLTTQGRFKEAAQIMQTAAKINKTKLPNEKELIEQLEEFGTLDNLDYNSSSITAQGSFPGTGIIISKFPTQVYSGIVVGQAIIQSILLMSGKFFLSGSYLIMMQYTAELFPTVVRNTGMGLCSMVGRVTAIFSPFMKELGEKTSKEVPYALYAVLILTSVPLLVMLPKSSKEGIPDTLEELEKCIPPK